jgi:hypothetical protein
MMLKTNTKAGSRRWMMGAVIVWSLPARALLYVG